MTQFAQINKPIKLNLDKARKSLKPDEAFMLLNNDPISKPGKQVPLAANFPACDIAKPGGENYAPNTFYSPLTKEQYSWVYNTNGVHFLKRINSEGICQIVYAGCLSLNANPKNDITQWRAYMKIDKLCANVHGKQLIWTNGEGAIYQIDVEASIATNYFNTPFFSRCGAEHCDLIRMCVPDPCGPLTGEFIPFDPADIGKTNNLLDTMYKFSYRHINYDGRASIWADPSIPFFQDTHGCFDNAEGFSRCIKLRVPIGGPLVDKIEIGFWKEGVWYLAETIDKYKKYTSAQQYWYERDLAEIITGSNFSEDDCSFDYTFCNDKQCDAIDVDEFNRVFNPIPRDAQALMPVGLNNQELPALGVVNYRQGNCPIDKTEIEKFDVRLDCADIKNCPDEFVTVTVRAVIHNATHDRNQFIYRQGGTDSTSPDDPTDTAYFGGLNPALGGGFEIGYDQFFNEKTRDFIVYAEGTDYWKEMEQWKAHANFTSLEKWQVIGNMSDVNTRNRWRRATRNGEFFYQEAKIKVLKGTRGFLRLTSQHSTGNDQTKSTFVKGIISDIRGYKGDAGTSTMNSITNYKIEEIYFDTCNGDVDLKEAFLIDDNATDSGLTTKASAFNGYVKDNNGNPVEGAIISNGGAQMSTTDHNGFYHFYINPGDSNAIDFDVLVERDCFNFTSVRTESIAGAAGFNTQHDITIDDQDWSNGFYANVNMRVVDCDGNGVGGIRIALSGTKYKSTGGDGVAHFRIRNYIDRNRVVTAIVLNNRGCITLDCGGSCQPCMPKQTSATLPCYSAKPTVTLPDVTVSVENFFKQGLKSGGRYPWGIYARGDCGRISAVYPVKYLDIPRVQDTGSYGFCRIAYNGNGIMLPDWVKCLDVVRGDNVNPFELQWLVDKVERTGDNKIRLTIQSINDYNAKFFFKTNTVYQWLAGDRVEFIKNGDGSVFRSADHGLLNYQALSPFHDEVVSGQTDAPADFFNQLLITDDGKLDSLTEGALIELQRAKTCTTEPTYFSIGVSIPVVNGRLVYDSGVFTTFDTYIVNRNIGTFPSQSFEHHSPSDFWGTRFNDTGRAYFVNKFENEKRFGRNISINAPNVFNRFGDLVKTFNQSLHGDIIAVSLLDDKIGLAISEHDNSLFEVGNDLLKVGGDGIVRAVSADQVISNPEAKIVGQYGCSYDSIGSIYFGDGYATWVDISRHCWVIHNYQLAESMDFQQAQTYFRKRCDEIQSWNKSQTDPLNMLRFSTGLNYDTRVLHLTIKTLRDSGVMNELAPYKKRNETLMAEPQSKTMLGFASFTPEAYGRLEGIDCAFMTYYNGIPYIHPVNPEKFYNEFYGIACDWIIGITLNDGPRNVKEALAMEIQSDYTFFYVKEVTTDRRNYKSEVPAKKFVQNGRKWNAAFLGNINSRDGLHGDERPIGYEINVLFCRDNTDAFKYNTIDNNKRTAYSELDMILMKASIREQAGFEQNL